VSASAVPVSAFRGYRFPPEIITHAVWRHPRRGDKWHLDEVALRLNKRRYWLWRGVDQDGTVLDILVQSRRDQRGRAVSRPSIGRGGRRRRLSDSPDDSLRAC
jgi:hypothetical protein